MDKTAKDLWINCFHLKYKSTSKLQTRSRAKKLEHNWKETIQELAHGHIVSLNDRICQDSADVEQKQEKVEEQGKTTARQVKGTPFNYTRLKSIAEFSVHFWMK